MATVGVKGLMMQSLSSEGSTASGRGIELVSRLQTSLSDQKETIFKPAVSCLLNDYFG